MYSLFSKALKTTILRCNFLFYLEPFLSLMLKSISWLLSMCSSSFYAQLSDSSSNFSSFASSSDTNNLFLFFTSKYIIILGSFHLYLFLSFNLNVKHVYYVIRCFINIWIKRYSISSFFYQVDLH